MRRVRLAAAAAALLLAGLVIFPTPAGGEASCGLDFVEGGTYRVYSKDGRTNLCAGTHEQGTPAPQSSIDGFPMVWLAAGGGLAVAALILYFLHIRRL